MLVASRGRRWCWWLAGVVSCGTRLRCWRLAEVVGGAGGWPSSTGLSAAVWAVVSQPAVVSGRSAHPGIAAPSCNGSVEHRRTVTQAAESVKNGDHSRSMAAIGFYLLSRTVFSAHPKSFLLSCCLTSTEARWPIRDGDRVGRGRESERLDRGNRPKKTGETVDRRQNNGSVKAVSPRHCPATCALRNCSFNCCAGQSH